MIGIMSPSEVQAVQILTALTMSGLVASRFLPARWRQPVGLTLTVAYVAGSVAGLLYLFPLSRGTSRAN